MPGLHKKNLSAPDERREYDHVSTAAVELGDITVARVIHQPGWRWSEHMRPIVGGEWCQARHVGIVVSGHLAILLEDGRTVEFHPDDVFDVPPRHDGYTLGDEPVVLLEWSGFRTFTGFTGDAYGRVLATLLFTDLVGSTALASRLGDIAWHELLSSHYEAARAELERFGGVEVSTTGDGIVARFDGPARAIHCATAIRRTANAQGLHIRAGVHVGEVQLVGGDVRGVAVHEAARIMAAAGEDQIFVSETTRALALTSGLSFDDAGTHTLKGIPGEWRLFAYVSPDVA